jgi:hypothetical protein
MDSKDKFVLDLSTLQRPTRRSRRLNKNVNIFNSFCVSCTYVYLNLLTYCIFYNTLDIRRRYKKFDFILLNLKQMHLYSKLYH